jgi:hypothetical protein
MPGLGCGSWRGRPSQAGGVHDRQIPVYENEQEAQALLEEVYEDIFASKLESWSLDQAGWLSPRSFALFQEWFEIHFYDLIEDLWDEDLEHGEVDEQFAEEIRAVLRDRSPAERSGSAGRMAKVVAIGLAILAGVSSGGIRAEPIKGAVL